MLSTTRSSAVWLLSTESLGLDSTRTLPKDSSSCSTPAMFPPRAAASVRRLGTVGALGKVVDKPLGETETGGFGGSSGPVFTLPPETWLPEITVRPLVRRADQSIPCWYWLFSWTSAIVASISTWRLTLAST